VSQAADTGSRATELRRFGRTYCEPAARRAQQDFYRHYPDGPSLYRLVRTLPPDAVCLGGQPDDRPQ
jgi:hypothetical protein